MDSGHVHAIAFLSSMTPVYGRGHQDAIQYAWDHASELKRALPEVEYASSLTSNEVNTFEAGGKILKEEGCYADTAFFTMFTYPLLEGDKATVLSQRPNIALSRKMAAHFFGSPHAAIGQPIKLNNSLSLK